MKRYLTHSEHSFLKGPLMNAAQLAGTHTLADGTTVLVTVHGRTAELRGTSPDGEATFTLTMPTAQAAGMLEGV